MIDFLRHENYHAALDASRLLKGACIVNTSKQAVIVVRLKDAIDRYAARTDTRLTYEALAERTGLSRATIESIATRATYNASLETIAKLCLALDCAPEDLLELRRDESTTRHKEKSR
jgi:DNA-binding Xre family transcriptional regulator